MMNGESIPKKKNVMALGLALELPLEQYEEFLVSAGYSFMPSSRFDLIVKYCVVNQIHNFIEINVLLYEFADHCFQD